MQDAWDELGINHQSPLIYCLDGHRLLGHAGNQSPIPFDILRARLFRMSMRWESITNPL